MASEKKAPVGTQSYWESTGQTWIKTHDNTVFDGTLPAWIVMPDDVPQVFKDKFKELDAMGKEIYTYRDPVDGDLWLDHEFDNFETRSGKTFDSSQFKQYSGWSGKHTGYYFASELAKRLLADKINLNAKIAENLVDANERKKTQLLREGQPVHDKKIFLLPTEVADIKKTTKAAWKSDDSDKLTLADVQDIEHVVSKILNYLKKGENFAGAQKEVYDKAKAFLDKLNGDTYENINSIRDQVREYTGLMSDTFTDNWGIRESYRKRLDHSFTRYISRFKDNIEAEELEHFKKLIGVSMYAPTEEFYGAIEASGLFNKNINFDDYIGKQIPDPYNKYQDVTLTEASVSRREEDEESDDDVSIRYIDSLGKQHTYHTNKTDLEQSILQREGGTPDLDIPFKLRFSELYHKDMEGNFGAEDLTLLETMEKVMNYLPLGHSVTNNELVKFRKESMFSHSDNSYAHYTGGKREIYLSSKAVRQSQKGITDIHDGTEIASVLIHETGHAVSCKIGRRNSKEYRKFVVECGWSWEQFQIGERDRNYIATGNDKDIKRYGTKSNIPLITEYAHKSPEEAFAENYSFYSQYKKEIDEFLETGHSEHLGAYSEIDTSEPGNVKYGDKIHYVHTSQTDMTNMDAVLMDQNRSLNDHIRTGVIDPYYETLGNITQKDVNPSNIAYQKRPQVANRENPQPVFSVFDYNTGKHDILPNGAVDDPAIHYSNKYLRRLTPTFSISKESYDLLKEKGYSHDSIRDYVLDKVKDKPVPKVTQKGEGERIPYVTGLRYRGRVIPISVIKEDVGIFRQMKKIWESDVLKKALGELGQIRKSEENLPLNLMTIFSTAKRRIKHILESGSKKNSMKQYADTVILNSKGEVLLLQRSSQDTFMPDKWGLPGGKVEPGETDEAGALREVWEETALDLRGKVTFLEKISKPDCTIAYYQAVLDGPDGFVLDNDEHYRMQFVALEKLKDYDLILDLGDILPSLMVPLYGDIHTEVDFSDLSRMSIDDLFGLKSRMVNLFNEDKITTEEYLSRLGAIKGATFDLLKAAFDKDQISTEVYQKARKAIGI